LQLLLRGKRIDICDSKSESRSGDLIVLDVRERDAFEEGHIPGAQLLPAKTGSSSAAPPQTRSHSLRDIGLQITVRWTSEFPDQHPVSSTA
jgi:rhodanese-related sulfurtransferase